MGEGRSKDIGCRRGEVIDRSPTICGVSLRERERPNGANNVKQKTTDTNKVQTQPCRLPALRLELFPKSCIDSTPTLKSIATANLREELWSRASERAKSVFTASSPSPLIPVLGFKLTVRAVTTRSQYLAILCIVPDSSSHALKPVLCA